MSVTVTNRRKLTEQDVISCDRDVVGGTPVFKGTRVPATTLFDYLLEDGSLDEFYEEFPTVTPDHVRGTLQSARDHVSHTTFPSRESAPQGE